MSKNTLIPNSSDLNEVIKNPGDELRLRVTDTGKKVATISTSNGTEKYSRTQYPNGTVHETKTTKIKK